MVKLSNRGKGKPTKRKTLKTKYKIERRVKQHNKKMRKEAKKFQGKGLKHKKSDKNNVLPNTFPFKHQILQSLKSTEQKESSSHTHQLPAPEWGLLALENKFVYFPKDKDHLTKKYITEESKIWAHANLIIEVLDSRNVQACIDQRIREECRQRGVDKITVVSKTDTVGHRQLEQSIILLQSKGDTVVEFTTDVRKKKAAVEKLLQKINESREGVKRCIVVGKPNTGKHTIIKQLMKLVKFYNEDYSTINEVEITENITVIDTPYQIKDETGFPLFHVPNSLLEQSVQAQEEQIIRRLFFESTADRNEITIHYGIQNFGSLDDLLKKIGKANRIFGKGGMVDLALVRTSILKDWYGGKLNHLFS